MLFQTIRKAAATLAITALCLTIQSQTYLWSEPQPITDSLADNRNAQVVHIEFEGAYDHFVFWERSEDPGSTAIYYKLLYEPDEPVALLETPGVHFRNPRFISNFWDDDTLFYMFYETDQNGSTDIYFKVYSLNGFGEPVLLAGTPDDDTHFRCDEYLGMAWQSGDKIMFAELVYWNAPDHITDPVVIDSAGCYSPDVNMASYITYLKQYAGTSALYYAQRWGAEWLEPVMIESPGENFSAHFAGGTCGDDSGLGISMVVWENVSDGEHVIRAWDFWDEEFVSGFTQEPEFFPDIALYMIPVDVLSESFLTFVNVMAGNGDIMVPDLDNTSGISPNLEDYWNLSNSSDEETNPLFFNGRFTDYCYRDLVDVWESYRNGHWQLFYSAISLYCCGGNEETSISRAGLEIYPNPARDECTISYSLSESSYVSLRMTTVDGRQVSLIDHEFRSKGEYNLQLDLERVLSGSYVTGMLMVSLHTLGGVVTRKVAIAR